VDDLPFVMAAGGEKELEITRSSIWGWSLVNRLPSESRRQLPLGALCYRPDVTWTLVRNST
jgi:hypothetical protein